MLVLERKLAALGFPDPGAVDVDGTSLEQRAKRREKRRAREEREREEQEEEEHELKRRGAWREERAKMRRRGAR